jgi:hypothetical protein
MMCFSSCALKSPLGPPFPKKQARKYLRSNGQSLEFINRLLNRKKLTPNEYNYLIKSNNRSVRYLLASNPYIPISFLYKLAKDKDIYIRQGVAENPIIDYKIINILKKDNISVQSALVENPTLPTQILFDLYEENNNLSLEHFSLNPNCPESIKQDILNSSDSTAKEYLKDVERWKKEGKYDSRGIWKTP